MTAPPKKRPAPRIVRNKRLRLEVFERDGGICSQCGRFDPKWIHEHIVALWANGPDTLENSETRCRRCEKPKTAAETTQRAKADRLKARDELTQSRRAVRRAQ